MKSSQPSHSGETKSRWGGGPAGGVGEESGDSLEDNCWLAKTGIAREIVQLWRQSGGKTIFGIS